MGRLIDADKLKEALHEDCMTAMETIDESALELLMIEIDEIPTAYDVDKVVEQLQQMKTRYFLTIANTGNETLDKIYEDVGNSIDKAISIVKGGGQG